MEGVTLRKYRPRNALLQQVVKYYWLLSSDKEVAFNNKLFPTNNVDFIINLSSPIQYGESNTFASAHFSGLKDDCCMIQQEGLLDVVGISFFSTGAYPVLRIPMWEFSNRTVELADVLSQFERALCIESLHTDKERIERIERVLLQVIHKEEASIHPLHHFIASVYHSHMCIRVNDYCRASGINQKTLERTFKKRVGISPKSFIRKTRFQKALGHIVDGTYSSLTALACDMGYFDQTHFTKDFQYYMHTSPLAFAKEHTSVMQLLEKV